MYSPLLARSSESFSRLGREECSFVRRVDFEARGSMTVKHAAVFFLPSSSRGLFFLDIRPAGRNAVSLVTVCLKLLFFLPYFVLFSFV